MEEKRGESDSGVFREPMEEADKGLGLSSKTETLDGDVDVLQKESFIEDANTVEVPDSGVCDASYGGPAGDEIGNLVDIGSVEDMIGSVSGEKTVSFDDVERTDAITEPETETNDMEFCGDETAMSEIKSKSGASHEIAGEEETVTSPENEVADEKAERDVEDNDGDVDTGKNVQTEKSQRSSVNGEMLSVAEKKADQEKESTERIEEDENKVGVDSEQAKEEKVGVLYEEQGNSGCETIDAGQEKDSAKKIEEDNNKMDISSKQANEENVGLNEQGNPGSKTIDAKHSESAQVPEESTQLSKGETNKKNLETVSEVRSAAERCHEEEISNVNEKEENGEAMEIDYAAEGEVEKDVTVGGVSVVQTQDVPAAESDRNDSKVVKEMEIDERKDNADMTSGLTGTIESADSAKPNSPTEDVTPGEVESLDHNALFDPSSDITNFIDFSGVSSWSGNIQDLKTETGNVSFQEDKKVTEMAEEVAKVDCDETLKSADATVNAVSHDKLSLSAEGIENEANEAHVAFGAESPAAATDSSKGACDAVLQSGENQEDKDHELEKETADQQDTMREEDDITHEGHTDQNRKEDTEMEENPNHFDYADDGTDSDIKTNGLKRKVDVLSEDSREGRKTVSLAKVSFAQRPSFKIGACIARAASQMAGSPSVLKASNFGDETLSIESFISQLHCAATDPVKENVVSVIAAGFFLDFRNSLVSQQVTPEKVSSKRLKTSNSNAGGTEAFEFEEMGDTYWTDRVIHNGGEEQTPATEKENYQIVPIELKPAQVHRTRRPYRRRQTQISIPHPSSEKPAGFDENAPAELIINFSEADTIPPEKNLTKMFRHFGPVRESQTEVDMENNRARVVFKKGADAEVAYNSVGRFNVFGTKAVNYELSYTITETFKVQPYVVSLGEEDATLYLTS